MNLSDTEGKSASGSPVSTTTNTRLSGSWLIVVRTVWVVLVVPSVGLFIVSLLVSYQQLQRACVWLALLAAFFLVMFNITNSGNTASALAFAYPILALPLNLVNFLGQVSLLVFFLLFPNGRFVPRWMGLVMLLAILEQFVNTFPSVASPFNANWPAWLNWLVP